MKISFFEIKGWEKKILKKRLKSFDLEFFSEPLTLDNIKSASNSSVISIFIYSKIDKIILSRLPKLKMITTRSTGFDHIDLKECRRREIDVYNVPFYGENTVAEHTFALILSLSRNVHKSYMRVLRDDFSIEGLKGFDLKGKTIGVVGVGHIGLNVVKIARGFGMNVLACDIRQDHFLAEVLDFKYVPFEELLKKSDIITFHTPAMPSTYHLINRGNIKKIKKGAILINTSRGSVIETEALIQALDKKILSGVGLDVLEGEKLIKEEKQLLYSRENEESLKELVKDHILLAKDNVVYTPHIAFYSQEALERILEATIKNILDFANNKKENIIN